MSNDAVNKGFISARLSEKGQTMKDLANNMDLDPTSLSKRINGKREFSAKEAVQLAQFLGLPIDKALQQIGLTAPPPSDNSVPLAGYINESLELIQLRGTLPPTDILHRNGNAIVYEFRTALSADIRLQMRAGMRIVTLPLDGVSPECLGRTSLVIEAATHRAFIGRMSRSGSSSGYFVQGDLPSPGEIQVAAASPIFAIYL